jgi:hypothetical protein
MPFDDEEKEEVAQQNKKGLKQVSSQKSIFEKKKEEQRPSAENFEKKIEEINKKNNDYKSRAAELALSYKKLILDKTLTQNKTVFSEEIEKETLSKMVSLAVEINNDEDEQEGMGTLGWVTLLLKYFLHHRDRVNNLEYQVLTLQKINEELKKDLNKLKNSLQVDSTVKSE